MFRILTSSLCGLVLALVGAAAAARPAADLGCIEAMFSASQQVDMARLGSADQAEAKAAADRINWLLLGMQSRTCAIRGKWSDDEYASAIAYMMAWPTVQGLRALGDQQGYAALDRAYAVRAPEFAQAIKLSDAQVSAVLAAAKADGLVLAEGENAAHDARRYIDALQQVDAIRADFVAGRRPRQSKD